jgi:hypothetical protein
MTFFIVLYLLDFNCIDTHQLQALLLLAPSLVAETLNKDFYKKHINCLYIIKYIFLMWHIVLQR